MNTPYEKLPDEQRQEWMEIQTTRAFFATIRSYRAQTADQIVTEAQGGISNPNHLIGLGGLVRALDFVLGLGGVRG